MSINKEISEKFVLVFLATIMMIVNPLYAEESMQLRGSTDAVRTIPDSREQIRFSFAPLVKFVSPAVVNVYAARQVQQRRSPFAGGSVF